MSSHTDSVRLLLWNMNFMHISPAFGTVANEHLIGMRPSARSGRVKQ